MDILQTATTLSTSDLKACTHNSLRNYFKLCAEEIESLRQQLAKPAVEPLIEALKKLKDMQIVEQIDIIDEAIAAYDASNG